MLYIFVYYRSLQEDGHTTGQANDMLKDISKYLYACDSEKADLAHLEDLQAIKKHLEACVEMGLGISGQVNRLTTFIAALCHLNDESPTLENLVQYRAGKSSLKTAQLKRKKQRSVI